MVSTHLKTISQIFNYFPQVGVKIKKCLKPPTYYNPYRTWVVVHPPKKPNQALAPDFCFGDSPVTCIVNWALQVSQQKCPRRFGFDLTAPQALSSCRSGDKWDAYPPWNLTWISKNSHVWNEIHFGKAHHFWYLMLDFRGVYTYSKHFQFKVYVKLHVE